MIERHAPSDRATALAQTLLADIRRRGLDVGDRYLTTEQASRMLGVRKAAANEAMRYLAEKEFLVRKQRKGTFVGPSFDAPQRAKTRTVCVLLPSDDQGIQYWSFDAFIEGIRSRMRDANVQCNFVSRQDPVAEVEGLLNDSRATGQFAGVVAVGGSPALYRHLATLAVPAVVYGTLYDRRSPLASIDVDNRQSGRLLTQHLLETGHRRLAMFLPGDSLPGHNDFHDGVSEVLSTESLRHDRLVQRLVSPDSEAFQAAIRDVLCASDRPTAVITRTSIHATTVRDVAVRTGLRVPDDLEIVFTDHAPIIARMNASHFPHVEPRPPFSQIAAAIGEMLERLAKNEPLPSRQIVVPVEFHSPPRV